MPLFAVTLLNISAVRQTDARKQLCNK